MKLKTKFQDEDFDLGEVVDASIMYGYDDKIEVSCTGKMKHRKYNSIKDFTDHWEDAPEEPTNFWYINCFGIVIEDIEQYTKKRKEDMEPIGNCFETKEEAEKAVEKLKAWKRLKDKGFTFKTYQRNPQGTYYIYANWDGYMPPLSWMIDKDLNLLFGGEE